MYLCSCCKWTCAACTRKYYPKSELDVCPDCGYPVREALNKEGQPCVVSVDNVVKSE